MPLPPSKKRVTLESIGAPEYWADIRLIAGMKYGDVRKVFGTERDVDMPENEYVSEMMEKLIINWNIPSEDGEEPLPLPSEDSNSVAKLHNIVVNLLVSEMSGIAGEDIDTENLKGI